MESKEERRLRRKLEMKKLLREIHEQDIQNNRIIINQITKEDLEDICKIAREDSWNDDLLVQVFKQINDPKHFWKY